MLPSRSPQAARSFILGTTKRIVCLAKSYKHGGLCVAGREVLTRGFGGWVRPVSVRATSELAYLEYRYEDRQGPELLDVIDVPLCGPSALSHQTENMLIDDTQRWVKRGRAAFRRLHDLCEQPASLWQDEESTSTGHFNCVSRTAAKRFRWSLCLIQVAELQIEVVRGKRGAQVYRVLFDYAGTAYKLSLTDPAAIERFAGFGFGVHPFLVAGEIFLTVSLSEPYKFDKRCHKLVAAILTDPPL